MELLKSIQDTQRGLVTNADQRCCIEESMAWYLHFPLFQFVEISCQRSSINIFLDCSGLMLDIN